jgi:type I restriction enzyme S subunit
LQVGDLLIVITGAGVTNAGLVSAELGDAYVSQHVGLVRLRNPEIGPWALLCLMAPAGAREELLDRAYGSGKPGLNLDNIRTLRIPLPPLAEQQRIVAKVAELIGVCDQLEQSLKTEQAARARLLETLLHDAFANAHPTHQLELLSTR